jgi:hypothetical protein
MLPSDGLLGEGERLARERERLRGPSLLVEPHDLGVERRRPLELRRGIILGGGRRDDKEKEEERQRLCDRAHGAEYGTLAARHGGARRVRPPLV